MQANFFFSYISSIYDILFYPSILKLNPQLMLLETVGLLVLFHRLISSAISLLQVVAVKLPATVIAAVVSAWTLLLTTMEGWSLNSKDWQE